jgi:hypothetical protein
MGNVLLGATALLCGCNAIFGLEETRLVDGPRAGCPDPSTTAPAFGRSPRPVVLGKNAAWYGFGDSRQLAILYGLAGTKLTILEGVVDEAAVSPPAGLAIGEGTMPRLAPESDQLLVRASTTSFEIYERFGTQWNKLGTLGIPVTANHQLSAPSRLVDGTRHIIVNTTDELHEYVGSSTEPWRRVATYTRSQLGLDPQLLLATPNLTPDGLRLVFRTSRGLAYADRAGIEAPFGTARDVVLDVPDVNTPHLLEDCSRLYFSIVTAEGDLGVYFVEP